MNKRYIKAILIGAAFGLATLLSLATCHSLDGITVANIQMSHIPLWDTHATSSRHVRPDLQATAVLLRFCMLLLHNGYYYLVVPIIVCCLFAKLEDLNESNIPAIAFRRALKATGLALTGLWILCLIVLAIMYRYDLSRYLGWDTIALATLEFMGFIPLSIVVGFMVSIFLGISPFIFVATLTWHYHSAKQKWSEKIAGVQSESADVVQK